MSDPRRTCKALTNPTREYTPDMVRDMLGRGTLRKAAAPDSPTMAINLAVAPPPPPTPSMVDPAYTLVDEPDEDEAPTHQLSADRAADMHRLLADAMPDGPPPTASTINITGGRRALGESRRTPAPPRALPGVAPMTMRGAAVPAPRHIARGSTPPPVGPGGPVGRSPAKISRTYKASPNHAPAALAETCRSPQMSPMALAATHRAPAPHIPPPPAMPAAPDRYQARAMRVPRPPSTLNGARVIDERYQTARTSGGSTRPRKRKTSGLSVGLAMIIAGALIGGGLALRQLEPTWWLTIAAVALLPAIALATTRFAARLLAWIRVPRPIIVVLAAVFGSVTLLGSAFLVSWAAGVASVPFPDLGAIAQIPHLLSARLQAVTGLQGPALMAWWAGMLLAVTMAASLGAARITGYRR